MAKLQIQTKDAYFEITGEQERFSVPSKNGDADEVLEWMRTATVAITDRYQRYFIDVVEKISDNVRYLFPRGGIIYLDDNKCPAFIFDDFRKGINNHVVFRVTYDPKAQYDVYKILWDMGGSSGAEWTQQVKEILNQIPPPGYYEWIEVESFPGIKGQACVWREGVPPGWVPRQPTSTTDTPQPNITIIAENIYGHVLAGNDSQLAIGSSDSDSSPQSTPNAAPIPLPKHLNTQSAVSIMTNAREKKREFEKWAQQFSLPPDLKPLQSTQTAESGQEKRRKPGRKHFDEDIKAWRQINEENLSREKVFQEWRNLPAVKKRYGENLKSAAENASTHFARIIKPDWYKPD
jgi:hypothetical protein